MSAATAFPEYKVQDVAERLGVPSSELRRCIDAGLLSGVTLVGGRIRLSFQDLSLLRSAGKLISARVPPHRVRAALQRLRTQIPEDRPLSGVALSARGGQVVARDGLHAWETDSR